MTHPEPHDLTALAYGLIEGDERDALLEHVADCDACREVYDSYRDEQVAVRDSILADARSGAAEAKALESTLRMLGAMDADETEDGEQKKKGKLIRMPMWLVAVEVAAALMVAAGLFFILKPDDGSTEEETLKVAEEDRAPAEVEQGVAYVQDNRGDWKQADAVPVDEWVKTGDGTFTFTLSDGSRTELEPNSVFRIKLEDGTSPVVYMLHGNGTIDTTGVTRATYVGAGDTGFYAMRGAKFEMICEGDGANRPRTWDIPKSVKARVLEGKVMALADGELNYIPLQRGEQMHWNGNDGLQFEIDGKVVHVAFATQLPDSGPTETPEGDNSQVHFSQVFRTGEMDPEAMKKLELFIPRLEEWDQHWEGDQPGGKGDHEKRMKELRKELETLRVRLKMRMGEIEEIEDSEEIKDIRVEVVEGDRVFDTTLLMFEDLGITIVLTSDGKRLTAEVQTPDGTTTHSGGSIEKLTESLKPEIAEMLKGVKTEVDDNGKLRIRGVETSGKNVKVRSSSQSSSNSTDD